MAAYVCYMLLFQLLVLGTHAAALADFCFGGCITPNLAEAQALLGEAD
jgi:hypothetical protein